MASGVTQTHILLTAQTQTHTHHKPKRIVFLCCNNENGKEKQMHVESKPIGAG